MSRFISQELAQPLMRFPHEREREGINAGRRPTTKGSLLARSASQVGWPNDVMPLVVTFVSKSTQAINFEQNLG